MPTRINLADGQWIDILEPDDVPDLYTRPLDATAFGLSDRAAEFFQVMRGKTDELEGLDEVEFVKSLTEADMARLQEHDDYTARALIVGWSFDGDGNHPDVELVRMLPRRHLRAIQEALKPYSAKLLVDFSPAGGAQNDPDSPTGPSNE